MVATRTKDSRREAVALLVIAVVIRSALEGDQLSPFAAPDDVVKTAIYVVCEERSDLTNVWRVLSESQFVTAPSTLLGVTHLGYEGQLVEIEAIAIVP
jgi:enamine deaminase RidA (YjgF/YER057c/UK114 family)